MLPRHLTRGFSNQPQLHNIDRKRVDLQLNRIDACDTLLDYVHDDIPHSEQQAITDQLNVLRGRLTDEMEDALT
jgi:hypothetical protein